MNNINCTSIVAKCTGTSGTVPELSDLQRTAPELLLSLLLHRNYYLAYCCTGAASSAIYSRIAWPALNFYADQLTLAPKKSTGYREAGGQTGPEL